MRLAMTIPMITTDMARSASRRTLERLHIPREASDHFNCPPSPGGASTLIGPKSLDRRSSLSSPRARPPSAGAVATATS
eukprot:11205958-Lingulodinium_polyedra.AAC.1